MSSISRSFVHLHVHTDHSLLDGCARIDKLFEQAQALGMQALAITDHGNLFGLPQFFQTAKKYAIKPLLGCEIYLVYDYKRTEKPNKEQAKYHHMGIIAQNMIGYKNLIKLVSDAHIHGFYYKPRTDMEMLAQHSAGLIGLTGCMQGVVPQYLLRGQYEEARQAMGRFIEIFTKDRYFVEIQDHGLSEQKLIIPHLLKLASEFDLKVICTNDVHYVKPQDWSPHDALICIQTGAKLSDEKRLRYTSHQFYLKSADEMAKIFGEHPESLTNTCHIADMCDLQLPFGENHYPIFKQTESLSTPQKTNRDYIQELCIKGLKERYSIDYYHPEVADDPQQAQLLIDRINYELSIIEKTGFIDYFLIVWDFIDWAQRHNISVGPGRGSGSGCIIAYLLKITNIDPIRFGLLFERFLNPERVSPPDFDIDFCMRRRGEVIEYVRQKYGKDAVANIITFGTFGAKMVIRDLARVQDLPYAEGDRLAKMIPDDLGISLEEAAKKSSEFQSEITNNPVAQRIFEEGKVIEGMVRNVGTHAAGLIISDQPLTELIPLTLQDGILTTQYPKEPVEEMGLLKIDFLGLKTLTIIADTENNIRRLSGIKDFNINHISFEDPMTFKLLNEAKTIGVFQLESSGMQSLCRQFNITTIDEIIALVSLYRPGPMEWIPEYTKGKKDPSSIQYPHPLLEAICKETYGVMVYQEQVMEAARRIAGYTLGGADILRRAMGKKKPEEMARQRSIFIEGAQTTNQISKEKADAIFNILEKFAGYGFNKSHAAAYAILAYQTAYLKANYPIAFMAAILSNELGNADKVAHFIEECTAMNIAVWGPNINQSYEAFTPIINSHNASNAIRFGLGAIKGVGDVAADNILKERNQNGPFKDLMDFCKRTDQRIVNKRVLEALTKSGAFDDFKIDRQHLLDNLEAITSQAASLQKDHAQGQTSLFDLFDAQSSTHNQFSYNTQGPVISTIHKLQYEKELLGFYVSGHPMDAYAGLSEALNSIDAKTLTSLEDRTPFRLSGIILNIQKRLSKKDNRPWAFFTLATQKSHFTINLYANAYETYSQYLTEGQIISLRGTAQVNEGEVRLNANYLQVLDEGINTQIKSLIFQIKVNDQGEAFLNTLADYALNHEGPIEILFKLPINHNHFLCGKIAPSLKIKLTAPVFQEFRKHPGVLSIKIQTTPIPGNDQTRYQKRIF